MANVIGALLSEGASGKFGQVLIFRKGGNRDVVCFARPYKQKNSPKQLIVRKVYGLIQADYRIMDEDLRKQYNSEAIGKHMTGHNIFYQEVFPWIYDSVCGESHCAFGHCLNV